MKTKTNNIILLTMRTRSSSDCGTPCRVLLELVLFDTSLDCAVFFFATCVFSFFADAAATISSAF